MKQKIIIGNRVDDGTGDYLRKGGSKINDNFDELYYNLGDGNIPHAAGAWKPYSDHTHNLVCIMGQAWVINTTTGKITVNLPLGSPSDYGKVIRLRDVIGTWGANPVTLIPSGTNTIKGSPGVHRLDRNNMDVELVYCSPGNWDYVASKYVGEIKSGDMSSVIKREFIATEGQTDFVDIFPSGYNTQAINVYKRGNILYYGSKLSSESNYGSVVSASVAPPVQIKVTPASLGGMSYGFIKNTGGSIVGKVENTDIIRFYSRESTGLSYIKFDLDKVPLNVQYMTVAFGGSSYIFELDNITKEYVSNSATPDILVAFKGTAQVTLNVGMSSIAALDGYTIRLTKPCELGDVIVVETFLDGFATFRSSYETGSIRVYSSSLAPVDYETELGRRFVGDLAAKYRFSISEFGFQESESFNPKTLEILINGRQLLKAGSADIPFFVCDGADAITEESCIVQGGVWVSSGADFGPVEDANGRMREFVINEPLDHGDIITIRWFNNDIGSLLDLEDIIQETDSKYVASNQLNISGKIKYSDPYNPSQKTVQADPNDQMGVSVNTIQMMFDIFHPVGTVYENAHNPNNPATYMGMGTWVRWAEGMTIAGWNSENPNDPIYGLNHQDLDVNGQPRHSSGGFVGENEVVILPENTPGTTSTEKALIADPNGDVLIGGCQYDPDEQGPGFKKYKEDFVYTRPNAPVNPIGIVQPTATAHRWLRVE